MRTVKTATRSSCFVILSLLAVVAAVACSPTEVRIGEGELSIQTPQASYAAGDTVFVRLHNIGADVVVYSPCHTLLDRWEGNRWVEYGSRVDFGIKICNAADRVVESNETVEQWLHIPAETATGTYRFRFEAMRSSNLLALDFRLSNPFAIQ